MRAAYRVETIRAAEQSAMAGLPPGTLMQRAAAGLATEILGELRARAGRAYGRRVLLAVGPGDNGGDALFAGLRLLQRGVVVRAWRTSGRAHAAAWDTFLAAGGAELDRQAALTWLPRVDLVVDGVLGIGGRPGLPEAVATVADACRALRVPVVAVDLPSGLSADTPNWPTDSPSATTHFTAALTVTFGELRLAHVLEPAKSACGRVVVVDIGVAVEEPAVLCWEDDDLAAAWPFPTPTSDKYSRGVVALDVGSARYPGAGVLATLGALAAGAGMVRFVGPEEVAPWVRQAAPRAVVGAGRAQAWVLGCGWGGDLGESGSERVRSALAGDVPVVLDADALRYLPEGPLGPRVLLTPHAGELAEVLGWERLAVQSDPIGAVTRLVEQRHCAVLLKGATQYVKDPSNEPMAIAAPGVAWTARAGSGDVLAGVCGALLAAGLTTGAAALAGASVQALAGRQLARPNTTQTTIPALASVITSLRSV